MSRNLLFLLTIVGRRCCCCLVVLGCGFSFIFPCQMLSLSLPLYLYWFYFGYLFRERLFACVPIAMNSAINIAKSTNYHKTTNTVMRETVFASIDVRINRNCTCHQIIIIWKNKHNFVRSFFFLFLFLEIIILYLMRNFMHFPILLTRS